MATKQSNIGRLTGALARIAALIPGSARSNWVSWFWSSILLGAGFLIAILVFSLIFKLMPDRVVRWTEAFSGALVSTLLWEIGSYIFVKLVPFFDYQRIYGRMGAVIALLAWVYTSNLIMLFGANFSAQLHRPALVESPLYYGIHSTGQDKIRLFSSLR